MPFEYSGLWKLVASRGMKKTDLIELLGITPSTLSRLSKNETVAMDTLDKLCGYFDVDLGDIVTRAEYGSEDGAIGTFLPNKSERFHRWFPYLEGYSKRLVETELQKLTGVQSVFDPFAGSGTTPLVASLNNISSFACEINPLMAFVSRVKIQSALEYARMPHVIDSFVRFEKIVAELSEVDPVKRDQPILGTFDKYFETRTLYDISAYLDAVDTVTDSKVRDLAMLALASVAVPVSRMMRRGDLRFARKEETSKVNQPFWPLIKSKLRQMVEDLDSARGLTLAPYEFLSPDVRSVTKQEFADAVITSPPYLNGTNYFRNTKLELKLMGMIGNESDLSNLYATGITAGINNVSKRRVLSEPPTGFESIYDQLSQDSYDKRIPTMFSGYFADMKEALLRIESALKPGGHLIIDIGDSQFAGVHIPTHTILESIILNSGLNKQSETVLRTRRSRNGHQLSQRILRFRKD